ncbi:MAG: TetR family transcriptional regulator, partial [Actinobacteria bacterium]|nr:TetR family transcriptional regulator [Actinomycetota bacterium]
MNVSGGSFDARGDQIVTAALATLNADPGASMAEIAEAAGVGRATLHRRFATRDDLVLEIGHRSLGRWEATLRASGVLELTGAEGAPGGAGDEAALGGAGVV